MQRRADAHRWSPQHGHGGGGRDARVEIGQLVVIVLVLPLVIVARRKDVVRARGVPIANVVVVALGLVWLGPADPRRLSLNTSDAGLCGLAGQLLSPALRAWVLKLPVILDPRQAFDLHLLDFPVDELHEPDRERCVHREHQGAGGVFAGLRRGRARGGLAGPRQGHVFAGELHRCRVVRVLA